MAVALRPNDQPEYFAELAAFCLLRAVAACAVPAALGPSLGTFSTFGAAFGAAFDAGFGSTLGSTFGFESCLITPGSEARRVWAEDACDVDDSAADLCGLPPDWRLGIGGGGTWKASCHRASCDVERSLDADRSIPAG